ncbi:hypothetical protein, partial [Rhodococcus koreensis]
TALDTSVFAAQAAKALDTSAFAAQAAKALDTSAFAAQAAKALDTSVLRKAMLAQSEPSLATALLRGRTPPYDPAPIGDDVVDADEVEQDDER